MPPKNWRASREPRPVGILSQASIPAARDLGACHRARRHLDVYRKKTPEHDGTSHPLSSPSFKAESRRTPCIRLSILLLFRLTTPAAPSSVPASLLRKGKPFPTYQTPRRPLSLGIPVYVLQSPPPLRRGFSGHRVSPIPLGSVSRHPGYLLSDSVTLWLHCQRLVSYTLFPPFLKTTGPSTGQSPSYGSVLQEK